jgi:hypothetical protein
MGKELRWQGSRIASRRPSQQEQGHWSGWNIFDSLWKTSLLVFFDIVSKKRRQIKVLVATPAASPIGLSSDVLCLATQIEAVVESRSGTRESEMERLLFSNLCPKSADKSRCWWLHRQLVQGLSFDVLCLATWIEVTIKALVESGSGTKESEMEQWLSFFRILVRKA